jgi:hypothetical protein
VHVFEGAIGNDIDDHITSETLLQADSLMTTLIRSTLLFTEGLFPMLTSNLTKTHVGQVLLLPTKFFGTATAKLANSAKFLRFTKCKDGSELQILFNTLAEKKIGSMFRVPQGGPTRYIFLKLPPSVVSHNCLTAEGVTIEEYTASFVDALNDTYAKVDDVKKVLNTFSDATKQHIFLPSHFLLPREEDDEEEAEEDEKEDEERPKKKKKDEEEEAEQD